MTDDMTTLLRRAAGRIPAEPAAPADPDVVDPSTFDGGARPLPPSAPSPNDEIRDALQHHVDRRSLPIHHLL